MDFLTQVRTSLAEQTLGVVRTDIADIAEYANRLTRDVPRLMALPNDRRQDAVVEASTLSSVLQRLTTGQSVTRTLNIGNPDASYSEVDAIKQLLARNGLSGPAAIAQYESALNNTGRAFYETRAIHDAAVNRSGLP